MEYVLTTRSLSKHYGHFKAISDLSMNVPKGAIYGFVGKNGAGKTTLIRLICGLQRPTDGSYTLYGSKYGKDDMSKARRRMGAVVETPSIYLNMTAEENLRHQYMILGRPSFDGIRELLELVGLSRTAGKRQRIFLSVCASASASPLPLPEIRTFSYWTNRSMVWTPRESLKCVSLY